jgi:hypothetical protein
MPVQACRSSNANAASAFCSTMPMDGAPTELMVPMKRDANPAPPSAQGAGRHGAAPVHAPAGRSRSTTSSALSTSPKNSIQFSSDCWCSPGVTADSASSTITVA